MAYDEVNKKTVYLCTGQPLPDDITQIVEWMLNDNFSTAYKKIAELKIEQGLALQDILTEIHHFIHRS
jgi:replication factor C subunit 3/5